MMSTNRRVLFFFWVHKTSPLPRGGVGDDDDLNIYLPAKMPMKNDHKKKKCPAAFQISLKNLTDFAFS